MRGLAAELLLDRPLALSAQRCGRIRRMLEAGCSDEQLLGPVQVAEWDQGYELAAGIAVVPVRGVLLPGSGWSWGGCTFYEDIKRGVAAAIDAAEVRAIALHVDSPGGTVAGCFDLVDQIHAMRGEKPIWAILDETAASAAYAIASAADRIFVPRTGTTGSIGVVGMHVDITGMLDEAGIKVTMLHFGARKVDSYPTVPLSDDARARAQADIDEMGELFVATVARNRGLDPDTVRATEAGTFLGAAGVAAGLADAVASPDEAFLALLEQLDQAA